MRISDTKQPENKQKPRTMHTLNYFCRPDHTILATRPSQWWLPGQQVLETCSKSLLFSIHLLIWINSLIFFLHHLLWAALPQIPGMDTNNGCLKLGFFSPFFFSKLLTCILSGAAGNSMPLFEYRVFEVFNRSATKIIFK